MGTKRVAAANAPQSSSTTKALNIEIGSPDEPTGGPHYLGHRERLRDKFRTRGAEALADYELLELLLFRSIPRRDTKELAKALIVRFGSFASVMNASIKELCDVPGIKEATATDLALVKASTEYLVRGEIAGRSILSSYQDVINYCRLTMAYNRVEEFRILFLDKRNHVVRDEILQRGTIDHTPVYPREVVKRALELGASALIIVHNHPSGDPTPSNSDILMTNKLVEATGALGLTIHDHLIIGREGHASFRALGLLD